MTDRPIIFSAPMVSALLAGRKTQTRRLIKPQPEVFTVSDTGMPCEVQALHVHGEALPRIALGRVITTQKMKYAVGDRLWVREAWKPIPASRPGGYFVEGSRFFGREAYYRSDHDAPLWADGRWRSPIHMPRWASRLTLTVTEVRVQRLQDISEEDAWAEGCVKGDPTDNSGHFPAEEPDPSGIGELGWDCARDWYADLWNSLHGADAWAANPWVAAYSFETHACNIDTMEAA